MKINLSHNLTYGRFVQELEQKNRIVLFEESLTLKEIATLANDIIIHF